MEKYENNKVRMSADSYAEFYNCVETLLEFDEYKYNLLNDPVFASRCDTFDSRVEPRSIQDILVALRMHPSSGDHGMSLFDKLIYTSLFSDYQEEEEEEGLNQIQPVLRDATVHLQFISDYITASSTGNNTKKTTLINQI